MYRSIEDTPSINRGDSVDDRLQSLRQPLAEAGVPELTGTAEQIAQARPIRTRVLIEADDVLTYLRSNATMTLEQRDTAVHPEETITPEHVHAAQAAMHQIRHQTDAAWWIENGPRGAKALIEAFIHQKEQG